MNQKEIRQHILSQRDALSNADVNLAAESIFTTTTSSKHFINAEKIGLYFSVKHEVDTHRIIQHALDLGKEVYLPVVSDRHLLFKQFDNETKTTANQYGINEPSDEAAQITIDKLDLLIIPLVACDKNGFRIGMGGGFYDRLLEDHKHTPYRLGIAYNFQYIENSYPESWDQALHTLITEQNIYNF